MRLPSIRASAVLGCLVLGAALWLPLAAPAEEMVGPPRPEMVGPPLPDMVGPPPEIVGPPPPPPTMAEEAMNMMDAPRDYLSEKLIGFVSSVDEFFGNERHYQETNDSVFQLDTTRVIGYGGDGFIVSGRANVHLPMAEKKLHLLIESDPDKNATVDPRQTQLQPLNQPTTPQSYGAALRYVKEVAERWHVSADGGIKFHGLDTTPFVRARASLVVPVDKWRAKLAETAFWFNTIGAGETTQLDLERPLSEAVLIRATSLATWLNDKQNFDLRQDLTAFHTLDERTALLYQASVIGVSQPVTQVTDYVLLMQYRYRLHRKWMYLDVSPQLHFPRDRSYRLSPLLSLRLEMLFDEMK